MPIYYTDTTIIVKYFLKKKFELKYLALWQYDNNYVKKV
jgi:hypothetical protein